jgi:hypothetical protein
MATDTEPVDGKQTLALQENALNLIEQEELVIVTAYAEVAGTTNNQATTEDVPSGPKPGPLHLLTAADATQAASVIAAQQTAGKTLAFPQDKAFVKAFVESRETIVLGFR